MNKVLIVDDHPVIRLAVRMLMERHGYEVMAETDNGVDALQLNASICRTLSFWILEFPNWMGSRSLPNDLGKPGKQGAGADFAGAGPFFDALHAGGGCGYVCKQQELTELLVQSRPCCRGTATFPIRRCTRGAQVWVVAAKLKWSSVFPAGR
jgi:two-component system response regulator EvgA